MRDLDTLSYHPLSEKIVQTLCSKTQNNNPQFFRMLVAYYLSKVAATMRCNINTHDRGLIPVNLYAINLAPSGQGKGYSTNIVEDQIINTFRDDFMHDTFHSIASEHMKKLAIKRANINGNSPDYEEEALNRDFDVLGPLVFSFDSGTTAAVKQMRNKLLMSGAGAINMEIDEIGSNLSSNIDILNSFLELYDVGKIKQKLTKNTEENRRLEDLLGNTPANMMLFGTPSKLLNGGKVEDEFYSMLEAGYARRCFFAYARNSTRSFDLTPDEIYDMLTNSSTDDFLEDVSEKIGRLADEVNFNRVIEISKDVTLELIKYKMHCEKLADRLGEHEEIRKAEISHRYFKALKLAGVYAFVDNSVNITEDHLYNAINLAEESGRALEDILSRDRPYVKLAKYIAEIGKEVTQADLVEDLPFYKGNSYQRTELLTLATAYGYKNNIIIKRSFDGGVEFLTGECLEETDLKSMKVSYSTRLADGYSSETPKFDDLHKLLQLPNYHWINHHLTNGHRSEENIKTGFNMVVIDIDGTCTIDAAKQLMKDYKYVLHTTKSHTPESHRFRMIFPISHVLHLDAAEYKEFMNNIFEWLPFDVDAQTNQRARKWLTHKGLIEDHDGTILDILQFIPKTSKNEDRKKAFLDSAALTNLERWFLNNTASGNRSNQLLRYALMLVDNGRDLTNVRDSVMNLNSKIADKLDEQEIMNTILVTANKAIKKRDGT